MTSFPQTPSLLGLVRAGEGVELLARAALPPVLGGTVLPFSPRRGRLSRPCAAELLSFPIRRKEEDIAALPVPPDRSIG